MELGTRSTAGRDPGRPPSRRGKGGGGVRSAGGADCVSPTSPPLPPLPAAGRGGRLWLPRLDEYGGACLVVLAALLALQISPWWFPTPDSAAYLSMARSLATTGTMRRFGSPHLFFSPGYPTLISPLFLLGPRPLLALAIGQWAVAVVLMLGVYRWARRSAPGVAVLLTAFVMLNTSLWLYLRRPVSEIAFMTALVWGAAVVNGLPSMVRLGPRLARAGLGSGWLALAGLIRPAGVLVAVGFVALAAVQVWRGAWRWGLAALLALIVVVPPVLAVRAVMVHDREAGTASGSSKPSYIRYLLDTRADLARQVARGLYWQVLNTGRLLVPGMFKSHMKRREWADPNLLLYVPVALAVLVGWRRRLAGPPDVLVWALPLYVGLFVVWPFDEDTRFLLPMLPALAACFWTVLERFRAGLPVLAVLVVAHLLAAVVFWVKEVPGVRACHAEWPAVDAVAATLPRDEGPVAVLGVRDCVAGMLTVALDRPVTWLSGAEVPGDVRRVVQPRARAIPSGFVTERIVGDYVLMTRPAGVAPAGAVP